MVSMTMLCLSGFYMSFVRDLQFTYLLSAFSIYLVITGWLAAKKTKPEVTATDRIGFYYISLFCVACYGLSVFGATFNWDYPETEPPYEAYAFIGVCAAFFLMGDIQYLRKDYLRKDIRIKRHITRTGSSMLIASIVFFLGNNHVLPESWRTLPILVSPIVTVCVFMLAYRLGYKRLLGNR